MKNVECEPEAESRQFGIVARALVAQERVLGVYFDPLKVRACFFESRVNQIPPIERNVRILPSPDMQ